MTNLQEVPTDELLNFQDFPSVHSSGSNTTIPISQTQITINDVKGDMNANENLRGAGDGPVSDGTGKIIFKCLKRCC